jgi:predicted DNA-binding protein
MLIRLDRELEKRLQEVAKETSRTKNSDISVRLC